MNDFIKLEVHLSPRVYARLRDFLGVKMMTGNVYGIIDEFAQRIVHAVESKESLVILHLKEEATDGMPEVS